MGDDWRVYPGGYPQVPGVKPRFSTKRFGRGEIKGRGTSSRPDAAHEHPSHESTAGDSPGDPVTGNPGGASGHGGHSSSSDNPG